ncbi:MAG: hypothetical protein AAB726_02980 [Patescibacteria group bacterium]
MKNNLLKIGALTLVSVAVFSVAFAPDKSVSAQTNSSITSACGFSRDLYLGSTGEDVRCLQRFLNSQGFTVVGSGPGSAGNESTYFGERTRDASCIRK